MALPLRALLDPAFEEVDFVPGELAERIRRWHPLLLIGVDQPWVGVGRRGNAGYGR